MNMSKFGSRELWQTAGIGSQLFGLDVPLKGSQVLIPSEVEISHGRLYWSLFRAKAREPEPGLLEEFLRIPHDPERRILAFARKWGVFGFCRHDLPYTHSQPPMLTEGSPCFPQADESDVVSGVALRFWEPLDQWVSFSRQCQAALNIAARLRSGGRSRGEDWEAFGQPYEIDKKPPWDESKPWGLNQVAEHINWLLRVGHVTPSLAFENGNYAMRIKPQSIAPLFGHIAVRLMLAVSGTRALPVCYECGQAFEVSRKPNPNRRSFCPRCRENGAHLRAASRDYYERKTHAQKTRKS